MNGEEKQEIKSLEKQGKLLADISGRIIAPLVGLIAAGPVGGIAGGIVGTLIKHGMEEFMSRYLTPKEIRRVGTSAEYMIKGINERLEHGGHELNEVLFQGKNESPSDAEEIFEGILLKSKNEYQEKKLIYISNIFVSAAFDKTISSANINQIINLADRLTYRQFCLISLIGKNTDNKYGLRIEQNRKNFSEIASEELLFLLNEVREMYRVVVNSRDTLSLNSYVDPAPADFILQGLGERIFTLMGLNEMPDEEYIFIEDLR